MHILISAVSSARAPSGICRYAATLALSLAEQPECSHVTLLTGKWQYEYFIKSFRLQHSKLDLIPVDISKHAGIRNMWYWQTLPRLSRQHHPDLVQLSFPIPFRRSSFGCPVVCTLHDLYPYDSPRNFGKTRAPFNKLFLRTCLNASDEVICSSDFTLSRLQDFAPDIARRKALRIYPAGKLDFRTSEAPAHLPLNGRSFLLVVAQHRANKNLDLLLQALAELRRRDDWDDSAQLVIAGGNGPETFALHDLVRRLSLHRHVVFAASLSDQELCWLYRHCALLVAPSSVEGFGLPVVEALHCGSRVLCSDIPAFREVAGRACHYFDITREEAPRVLADAIALAIRSPIPETEGLARFASAHIARQHLALYKRLIQGNNVSTASEDLVLRGRYAS